MNASGITQSKPKRFCLNLKQPGLLQRLDVPSLLELWALVNAQRKAVSVTLYKDLLAQALKIGEPLLAYDVVSHGLELWPKDVRLRQLQGLALANCGATKRANKILTQLYAEGNIDGETLGILARTHKDLWGRAADRRQKQRQLRIAFKLYYEGYQRAVTHKTRGWHNDAIYNGINAATIALFMAQPLKARELARAVRMLCLKKKHDYWALASLGEASIINGDLAEAEEWYSQAAALARGNYGDIASTRRQARMLLEHLGHHKQRFDHCFGIPNIVIFSCHPMPQSTKEALSALPSAENRICDEIASRLKKIHARIGYCSVASYFELLFIDEMLKHKAEINVVLPFQIDGLKDALCKTSAKERFLQKFEQVFKRVKPVIIANEYSSSESAIAYEYAMLLKDGLALLKAHTLDTGVTPLLLHDSRNRDSSDTVKRISKTWLSRGVKPEVINLVDIRGAAIELSSPAVPCKHVTVPKTDKLSAVPQKIMAMLFADVAGYKGLSDEQVPLFVRHFMGSIAHISNMYSRSQKLKWKNTWGDAVYYVFSSVIDAGNFALELRDIISNTAWELFGLPKGLSIRIALHAGPTYHCLDPVINKYIYNGSHVSRAAMIEPITPPGEVFVSQEFAALLAAQHITDFTCEYIGQTPLSKKAGIIPLYILKRTPQQR